MSNIFVTSDLHISHNNILGYCQRPFNNIQEMNSTIRNNWNSVVSDNDIVYLLGDYLFKKDIPDDWHLNGYIILIRGNHDRGLTDKQLKEKFCISEVHKTPITIVHNGFEVYLMHAPRQLHPKKINLCGHVHDAWLYQDGFYNVGCDMHNFTPKLLDAAIEHCVSLDCCLRPHD